MDLSGTSCPHHPDADVGCSEEHVFCLSDGCFWEEELCWDYSRAHDPPLHCIKIFGHDGRHVAFTETGDEFSWQQLEPISVRHCSSCGDVVTSGADKCAACEKRILQQVLLGNEPRAKGTAKCTDCGIDLMGHLDKLCKACSRPPRQLCVRCGVRSYGPKYCVKCDAVMATGSAPKP